MKYGDSLWVVGKSDELMWWLGKMFARARIYIYTRYIYTCPFNIYNI